MGTAEYNVAEPGTERAPALVPAPANAPACAVGECTGEAAAESATRPCDGRDGTGGRCCACGCRCE